MKEIQLFGGEQNAPEGIKVLFMFLVTANSGLSCDSQQESLRGILPSESFADQILFYFFFRLWCMYNHFSSGADCAGYSTSLE